MIRWLVFFWFLIIAAAVVLVWEGPIQVDSRTATESSKL
jgi:hypothetical protein